jgi:hypothetical protein
LCERSEQALEWTARTEDVPLRQLVAVEVDVGKPSAMVAAGCRSWTRTAPAVPALAAPPLVDAGTPSAFTEAAEVTAS